MAKNLIVRTGWYERRPSDRRAALIAAPFQWLACRLLALQDRAQQRYALEELDPRLLADVGLARRDVAATRVKALPERVECLCFARVLPSKTQAAKGLDRKRPFERSSPQQEKTRWTQAAPFRGMFSAAG